MLVTAPTSSLATLPAAPPPSSVVVHSDPSHGGLGNLDSVAQASTDEFVPPATVNGISLRDRVICIGESTVLVTGGLICESATIYTAIFTTLPNYVPIVAGVIGGLLIAYPIVHCTCGSWARTTSLVNNITATYNKANTYFQHLLKREQVVEGHVARDVREDTDAVAALANVTARANEDAIELTTTLDAGRGVANSLAVASGDLRREVGEESVENQVLISQINNFSSRIVDLHSQIDNAEKTIPELRAIDLSFDHSVASFGNQSNKILTAFSALISQVRAHAATIEGLNSTVKNLLGQIEVIRTSLEEAHLGRADLEAQMEINVTSSTRITEMNNTLLRSIDELNAQIETLKRREAELLLEERNEDERIIQAVQKTTEALNAPSDLKRVTDASAATLSAARRALEDSDNEEHKEAVPTAEDA